MDRVQLKKNLRYLMDKYIEDIEAKKELQVHINNSKAKFILGEIDKKKSSDYSSSDKELIKDIYFYYC